MGVTARRGRKNDRKRRGDNLSTGSINPCADTVQAAFLCKAGKTRVSIPTAWIYKKETVFKSAGLVHPSARREGILTFGAWPPLLAAAGFNQLWLNIRHESLCECRLLPASYAQTPLTRPSWTAEAFRRCRRSETAEQNSKPCFLILQHMVNLKSHRSRCVFEGFRAFYRVPIYSCIKNSVSN